MSVNLCQREARAATGETHTCTRSAGHLGEHIDRDSGVHWGTMHRHRGNGKRGYNVLIERAADTDIGDLVFVLLGCYNARSPDHAAREARRAYGLDAGTELVTVPAGYWRTP